MKTWIQSILVVFVILGAFNCHAESVRDGGMSGGGGNSQAAEPVYSGQITSELYTVRLELLMFFNRAQLDSNVQNPYILKARDKMAGVLQKNAIHASSKGCENEFGADVDGSIYSTHKNAICISLPNLQQKLRSDNLRPQLLALVAHEYSHLAGLNEQDAVGLQKVILSIFSITSVNIYEPLEHMDVAFDYLARDAQEAVKNATSWDMICPYGDRLGHYFSELLDAHWMGRISALEPASFRLFTSFRLRVNLLQAIACGMTGYYPHHAALLDLYNQAYGSHTELLDSVLEKTFWKDSGNGTTGTMLIKKITSVDEARAELSEIAQFAKKQRQRILKMQKQLIVEPLY